MIIGPDTSRGGRIDCDVVVVGSGAGGAAAAWQLSRAGKSVVCLEAGGHYTEQHFSQDFGVAARQLYEDDGQRVMMGNLYVPLPGGRCLGGSTVVNSGICFRIPPARFGQWQESNELTFEHSDLLPHTHTTEQMIGVAPSRTEVWGGNNQFAMDGLTKLGWSGGPMPRNAPGCVGCGACNTGCPSGSKLSTAKTFIPRSEEHGAVYCTYARADGFLRTGDRIEGVTVSLMDPRTEQPAGRMEVRAKAVVLSCGAVRTPEILQRNGLGNAHVGQHLHVHAATGVIGITDREIEGWKGIPQGFYSDEFHVNDRMLIETFWATPEVYWLSFPFGFEGTAKMMDYRRMAAIGGTIADTSEGTVKASAKMGRVKIKWSLNEEDKGRLIRLQQRVCEIMIAAGATEMHTGIYGIPPITSMDDVRTWLVPDQIRAKQMMAVYASHPQGTCRMAGTPEVGAVDCDGRLYGTEGLYVMDGSIFPDVLGVNPQVTIMSMALMLSEKLARSL